MDDPATIGDDPYGDGWLLKILVTELEELEETLTAEEYADQVGA
jgi:glycine cleavage system H protein